MVGDVRHTTLSEEVSPQIYLPQAQFTDSFLVLAVRTETDDPGSLATALRSVVREMDPSVPVYDVVTLEERLAASSARTRFVTALLGAFAAKALLLSAVGLYGIVAYTVAQRTREVGIRIALGARRGHVLRLVFGSGAAAIAAGLVVGLALALPVARLLESQLFGVSPADPLSAAGAFGVIVAVATLAHVGPLRRAWRIDPTVALREE